MFHKSFYAFCHLRNLVGWELAANVLVTSCHYKRVLYQKLSTQRDDLLPVVQRNNHLVPVIGVKVSDKEKGWWGEGGWDGGGGGGDHCWLMVTVLFVWIPSSSEERYIHWQLLSVWIPSGSEDIHSYFMCRLPTVPKTNTLTGSCFQCGSPAVPKTGALTVALYVYS